jgi:hypothetical protein
MSVANIDFFSASFVNNSKLTAARRILDAQKPLPICIMLSGVG